MQDPVQRGRGDVSQAAVSPTGMYAARCVVVMVVGRLLSRSCVRCLLPFIVFCCRPFSLTTYMMHFHR